MNQKAGSETNKNVTSISKLVVIVDIFMHGMECQSSQYLKTLVINRNDTEILSEQKNF